MGGVLGYGVLKPDASGARDWAPVHFSRTRPRVRPWPVFAPAKPALPPSLAVVELGFSHPWLKTVRRKRPATLAVTLQ